MFCIDIMDIIVSSKVGIYCSYDAYDPVGGLSEVSYKIELVFRFMDLYTISHKCMYELFVRVCAVFIKMYRISCVLLLPFI